MKTHSYREKAEILKQEIAQGNENLFKRKDNNRAELKQLGILLFFLGIACFALLPISIPSIIAGVILFYRGRKIT